MTFTDRTHAAGRRRIAAGTAGNDDVARNSPACCEFPAQRSGRVRAFDEIRHLPFLHAGGRKQAFRPAALGRVEP
ncbi:hypothetical protein D3C78_1711080 [compost metagenome]